ncbi:hypothetical protein ACL1GJ_02050 [Corynebacterium striatum]|uniref:hypothetical protein n=1 Tax=Corynebacterium striatum TaxID=43770 RepID=UPI0027B8A308|nr:hypothetical protein [Corynebacterium striatum]
MPMHPLTADGGEVTVLRSLAAYSYGAWDVSWPDSVPEEQQPDPGEGRQFGYFADFNRTPGRMGRRFVRNDVSITAAEYINGELVPHSGVSDVEDVLDSAENRTSGEAYLEREIPDGGLGGMIPYLDFGVDDIVPVSFWGKLMFLPVTEIRLVSSVGDSKNYVVHVGGSLLADIEARNKDYNEMARLIAQERRERTRSVNSVERSASRAQSTADRVRTEFDELKARVERDARVVADEISRTVSQADFEEYNGQLHARLWGEQGEFNRITADSLSKQEQINAQQTEINKQRSQFEAQQHTINDQQKEINRQQGVVSAQNQQILGVIQENLRLQSIITSGMPRIVHIDTGKSNLWTSSSGAVSTGDAFGSVVFNSGGLNPRGSTTFTAKPGWVGTVLMLAVSDNGSSDVTSAAITESNRTHTSVAGGLYGNYKSATVFIFPASKES